MHEIWYKQQVTLWTSSATLCTERLLISETEQQESDVMGQVMEGLIIESNTLLKVAVVPVRKGEIVRAQLVLFQILGMVNRVSGNRTRV